MAMLFDEFFRAATGSDPYPYQSRVARDGLPAVLVAPTGAGKTGVVIAWLWRLLYKAPARTPRRMVYALPQRSLVEQVAGGVAGWLANLGLGREVALHVVMGGAGTTQRRWRMDVHRPAVVVGTVDSLVSKALNRGYGIARATYPIDFALVTNGAQWIVDEVQLCPESTTTLRQLAGFAVSLGTAEPFGLTCMSATVPAEVLDTVDNPMPGPGEILDIGDDDRAGPLRQRLAGLRTVRRLPVDVRDPKGMAAAVMERHRSGTLTLVVVNTVRSARAVYGSVRRGRVPCMLLHSRFRARDRTELMRRLKEEVGPAGRIVVATQVAEAGIDIDAATLVTEAAPWPSIVQRAGRCNRAGAHSDADLWWLLPAAAKPYEEDEIDASAAELASLEGVAVTGEDLQSRPVPVKPAEVLVLRRPDLFDLFDTAPDLSGGDVDISPYVRDADDLDVQLAWAVWDAGGAPPDDATVPAVEHRCRVPIAALRDFAGELWRRDQAAGRWRRVGPQQPARPGEVLVTPADAGGYNTEVGFDPSARDPVPDAPRLLVGADRVAGAEDGFGEDSAGDCPQQWVSLDRHSEEVREQARALVAVAGRGLPTGTADAVVQAAYAHDVGKCHPVWQEALCRLAPDDTRADIDTDRLWAKSHVNGPLRLPDGFRHELVSLLLLDGPLSELAADSDRDLVRYLVLAHHGKLRVQVRSAAEGIDDGLLGLRSGATVETPPMLGQPAGRLVVELDQFTLGGSRSWTRTALALRDRYGPFVLAYLETLVRVADWRASAGEPIAGTATVAGGVI
jgi:CRISPR-associated endonuclease/helicase Cas3